MVHPRLCIWVLTVALAVCQAKQEGGTTRQSSNEQRSKISPREQETEDIEYEQEEQDETSQKRKENGRNQQGHQGSDDDNQQKSSARYDNKSKNTLESKQNSNYGRQQQQETYSHRTPPRPRPRPRQSSGDQGANGEIGWGYDASGTGTWGHNCPWGGHNAGWGWRFKGGAGGRFGGHD